MGGNIERRDQGDGVVESSTYIDGLYLAKLLEQVGEVLLSGLLIHLAHPQSRTAHWVRTVE